MIDLDELLYGNPTWAQVVDFWKNGEFYEESYSYMVAAIEKHLLTEDQRKEMFYHRLSVEKMLNGKFLYQGKEEECVDNCFKEWNAELGYGAFGFWH